MKGPRHDNDFVDFRIIEVSPTDNELSCALSPFLPANVPNAPHPFPSNSMERLLDIQFRLLREELMCVCSSFLFIILITHSHTEHHYDSLFSYCEQI